MFSRVVVLGQVFSRCFRYSFSMCVFLFHFSSSNHFSELDAYECPDDIRVTETLRSSDSPWVFEVRYPGTLN